jgi:hypothetical protein
MADKLEYMVVNAQSWLYQDIEEIVSAAISQGWEPQGGVTVAVWADRGGGSPCTWYQAMVRRTAQENEGEG